MPSLKQTVKSLLPRSARKFLWHRRRNVAEASSRVMARAMSWLLDGPEEAVCMALEHMPFTPDLVVRAYMLGVFPSPTHDTGVLHWHDPDLRGILPFENFHVSKRLARTLRQGAFEIRVDTDFRGVLEGCAETKAGRETTWVTGQYMQVYEVLHEMGVAHSVETWQDGQLVGGAYGVALGSYFAGESQFHRVTDAGKVAFVHLIDILKHGGFTLLDTWWSNPHVERFGGITVPRAEFKKLLTAALLKPARFEPLD